MVMSLRQELTTERLKPQRFLLEPFSNGAPTIAQFENPARPAEKLGQSFADLDAAGVDIGGNFYDPYENPLQIEFESKIAVTIQSAELQLTSLMKTD